MKQRSDACNRETGFSLVEVLVALVIISVGLLGIAKMQAFAFSSTGIASRRSLAAIEASSLAASMSANRAYWAATTAAASTTVTGNVVASTDGALVAPANCQNVAIPCTSAQVAAYDVQKWAQALQQLLFNDQATITCAPGVPAPAPTNCIIAITWTENQAAINSQEAAAATAAVGNPAAMQLPSYTLYVQP
jgi:type IV pilus assembly protein PilV